MQKLVQFSGDYRIEPDSLMNGLYDSAKQCDKNCTTYHSKYFAHRTSLDGNGEETFAKSLSTARVETKPHQVDASLFALHSPLSKGVILADEVGLGKTVEASLVIAQRWAERRRRILLIVPASEPACPSWTLSVRRVVSL